MKKFLLVITIVLSAFLIMGCEKEEEKLSDALKFKEEYESVNGNDTGTHVIREITISEDNPMIYKDAKDIIEMMENKESFAIYFGYNTCPWCRSVMPSLLKVAKDMNINKIYYVDIHDIRDVLSVNDNKEIETTKKGSEDYYKLLELLDNVLEDYTLEVDGKTVNTNEKRIYAPNIVSVIDGKAKKLDTCISDKQTDGYMELTDEMKEDMEEKITNVLKDLEGLPDTCGVGC